MSRNLPMCFVGDFVGVVVAIVVSTSVVVGAGGIFFLEPPLISFLEVSSLVGIA